MGRTAKSLVGQKFGLLTVVEPAPSDGGSKKWICSCECGGTAVVLGSNLTRGHTTSCGCKKKRDLSGKRIGRLTVIGLSDRYGSRGARRTRLWECLCDCGNTTYKATDVLTNDEVSMCADCAKLYAASRMREEAGYFDGTQLSKARSTKPISTNTSGVRGVYWDRQIGKWRARLRLRGKLMSFGCYSNFEDAVRARKRAEQEYYGELLKSAELKNK